MTDKEKMNPKQIARIAGVLYLSAIVWAFAGMFVNSSLIVPGDAATTAGNIIASEGLFRIGFMSDLFMILSFIFLPLVLYKLLKPVNKTHALLMVLLILISVPIAWLNMLNRFAALILLSDAGYLTIFAVDQLHALAMFFLDMHSYGYSINKLFFGLWLLPLGFLVLKSGYFPKILGVLLVIACFGYLVDFFTIFLFPDYAVKISPIVLAPAAIAELSLCLWLLLKGVKAH